jgi:hypothetical protein
MTVGGAQFGVAQNIVADELRHRALIIRLHAICLSDERASRELEHLADEVEAMAAEIETAVQTAPHS